VGADPATQTIRGMAERVAVMRRVWAGEKITESVLPVGPAPIQPGGPPLFVGTMGPKTVRSAVAWADGLAGTTLDLDVAKQKRAVRCGAGRMGAGRQAQAPPGDVVLVRVRPAQRARAQVHRHLRRYMNWIPSEYVDAMAPMTGQAGGEDKLLAVLRKFDGIGTDEVQLIPTSSDLDQLRRAADVVGRL
jgi:alkanesulfonate monooxygenase SsuD/methylene tetrahydromethanopterin reductase-like flavin-dependent oxidoreductase (luciferase family)